MSAARRIAAALAVLAVPALPAPALALGDYGATVRGTAGVVSYLPLDEAAAATTIGDVVGNRTATPSGTFALGQPAGMDAGGTSLTLTNQGAVNLGTVNNFTGDRTVEAWVAPQTTSGDRYVASKATASAGYSLYLANGGQPAWQVNATRITAPALRSGGWHHLVATLSGRAMALYVDGALAATGTVSNAPATSTQALWIGRLSRSSSGWFQGGLDEISMYSRALSAAEVAAHFTAGADTSPPAAVFTAAPDPVSDQYAGTFAFSGSKGGVTFTCSLDDGATAACPGTFAYDMLRDGPHSLAITATDRWGIASTRTYAWQVALPAAEKAAPVTTLTTTPAAISNSASAKFFFTASKSGVSFRCRLDGGAWVICPVGAAYTGLAEGSHTFEVQGTDRWGTVEAPARAFTWTVDLTPPDTWILARLPATGDPGAVALGSEAGVRYQCHRATTDWEDCPATFALPALTASERLSVRAIDAAGNADASPAEVTLDPPADEPISFAGARARFVIGGNRSVTYLACSLDGAAAGSCPWPLDFDGLAYGPHTLVVADGAVPGVVFPAMTWSSPLPVPRIVGSQFPALLQLGSHRHQATLAASRLPRMLFQSNSAGTARVSLRRGGKAVKAWTAPVVQGSNLVRLPRSAWAKLRPGRYTLRVVVANAAGASGALSLRFDAVRTGRR